MRLALVVLGTVACGDNHIHQSLSGDGGNTPPDVAADVLEPADAPLDMGPSPDAASDSATAVDAPPDAPWNDNCPHRTAPPGVPQDPIPPDATINGSVRVLTQADVDALAGIRYITGDLTFGDNQGGIAVASVTLPDLQVIGGSLHAELAEPPEGMLDELHLPRLETVGSVARAFHANGTGTHVPWIRAWDTPRLESVGATLGVSSTSMDLSCLATVDWLSLAHAASDVLVLPKLRSAGNVFIDGTLGTEIQLPELASAQLLEASGDLSSPLKTISAPKLGNASLELSFLPSLTSVTLGPSTTIPIVTLRGLTSLPNVDFLTGTSHIGYFEATNVPALASVAGLTNTQFDNELTIENAAVADLTPVQNASPANFLWIANTNAATIRFPNVTQLSSGSLVIEYNAHLTTLDLPNLIRITGGSDYDSSISYNVALPTCQALAIHDRVAPNSPTIVFTVTGNGPGTCPSRRSRARGP